MYVFKWHQKIINDKLREKAEKILDNQLIHTKEQSIDNNELIHDLRVHQIELEIQNEELRESQLKLEDSQRKYFDLYNFAPDGYFTLDRDGIILEVNLSGASLLGIGRQDLYQSAFIRYIVPEYRNEFHQYLLKVEKSANDNTVWKLNFLNTIKALFMHI